MLVSAVNVTTFRSILELIRMRISVSGNHKYNRANKTEMKILFRFFYKKDSLSNWKKK